MTKRSVFVVAFAIFISGYYFLGLSMINLSQSSTYLKEIANSTNIAQFVPSLPEKGTYSLNITGGEVYTNENSRIKVFDSKEQLVFSLPVSSFPTSFTIDSAGFYFVSLENVTMEPGTTLIVLHNAQNITLFAPYGYLSMLSKVFFVVGGSASFAVFAFYLMTRTEEQKNRSREFQESLEISWVRSMFGSLSIVVCPLALNLMAILIFGPLSSYYTVMLWAVALFLIAVYWFKLYDIIGLFLSVTGYRGLLLMRRILILLIALALIMYIPVYVATIWPTPTLVINGVTIFLLFDMPLMALLVLLMPFLKSLTPDGEARLALQEFMSAFRQNAGNADFRYIREASRCLASVIGRNSSQVSSRAIEKHITLDLLASARFREAERTDTLIQRIMVALNPFDSMALTKIVGGTLDEGEGQTKPRFDRTLELLSYFVVILGSVLGIIAAIISLMPRP